MFDFDCGGPGWRSYDLAVYRWATGVRNKTQNWKSFLDGYQQLRALEAADLEALPWFVLARCIWILGLHTSNAKIQGVSRLNDDYFDYWLKFMRDFRSSEGKE